jgi:hypothetical protein
MSWEYYRGIINVVLLLVDAPGFDTSQSVTFPVLYWRVILVVFVTSVALYILRTDHAQKTRFYCCARNIAPWTSHVTPSQYSWSVTSCACVEVCLPGRNLKTDCVNQRFHFLVRVLLRNGWFCGSTFLAWGKYATVLWFQRQKGVMKNKKIGRRTIKNSMVYLLDDSP